MNISGVCIYRLNFLIAKNYQLSIQIEYSMYSILFIMVTIYIMNTVTLLTGITLFCEFDNLRRLYINPS